VETIIFGSKEKTFADGSGVMQNFTFLTRRRIAVKNRFLSGEAHWGTLGFDKRADKQKFPDLAKSSYFVFIL